MLQICRGFYISLALVMVVATYDPRLATPQGGQGEVHKSESKSLPANMEKLQMQINVFLRLWLVDHDLKKARLFFSAKATSNQVMLHADCCGYIKEEQRKSQQAIKGGIEEFLRDFASGTKGRPLGELLDTSRFIQDAPLKALNDRNKNKYMLVELCPSELMKLIKDRSVADFLLANLRNDHFIFSLTSLEGSVLYFLWIQEAGEWRIFHIDLICA